MEVGFDGKLKLKKNIGEGDEEPKFTFITYNKYWWKNSCVHPTKGKSVSHTKHKCSLCKKAGHNRRTCPLAKV
jgi:hypothetical protein